MDNSQALMISYGAVFVSIMTFTFVVTRVIVQYYDQYSKQRAEETRGSLEDMFIFMPGNIMAHLQLFSVVLFSFLIFVLTGNWVLAFGGIIFGFFFPRMVISFLKKKRLKKMEDQLVPALETIINAMKAGYSTTQAIRYVVSELPPPISLEFNLVLRQNSLGFSLAESLTNMSERVKSKDFEIVVTAMTICQQLGGDMTDVLENIVRTIRDRQKIEGNIKTLTSQSRFQGNIVGLMPFLLAMVLYWLDPETMSAMFVHPVGRLLLGVMVIIIAVGLLVIRKMIQIKV
jgi:tight adherence protein B